MDTEGALQQVVQPFTDIHVEPGVTILQHYFFLKVLSLLAGTLEEADYVIMIRFLRCPPDKLDGPSG